MNINRDRLWHNLMHLGKIGRNEAGGITRLSFTPEEKEAKAFVADVMEQAGLAVDEDAMGNLFGRREGRNPQAPAVLIGSHVDSVVNGGMFDGTAGVLSGIEVLHTLQEHGWQGSHPVEVVAFTDEEGARFSTGMLGSQALVGQLTQEALDSYKDADGVSVADAMKEAGYDPIKMREAKRDPSTVKAYLELHIEQGKVLESQGLSVGVVTGIVGLRWLHLTLKGEAGHAGTTPMKLRRDPLAAASVVMAYLEDTVKGEADTVGTVGQLRVRPGGINIIPGEVELTMDIRSLSRATLDKVEQALRQFIDDICQERKVHCALDVLHRLEPVSCSPGIVDTIENAVKETGLDLFHLASGAGHDAMVMARMTDVGMIFVRSKDGVSHNPKEWTEKDDLGDGADVLLKTVTALAR